MVRVEIGTFYADACPLCHGVWLDGGEMRLRISHFTSGRSDEALRSWEKIVGDGKTTPRELAYEDTHVCPHDQTKLKNDFSLGILVLVSMHVFHVTFFGLMETR